MPLYPVEALAAVTRRWPRPGWITGADGDAALVDFLRRGRDGFRALFALAFERRFDQPGKAAVDAGVVDVEQSGVLVDEALAGLKEGIRTVSRDIHQFRAPEALPSRDQVHTTACT